MKVAVAIALLLCGATACVLVPVDLAGKACAEDDECGALFCVSGSCAPDEAEGVDDAGPQDAGPDDAGRR